jgi:hypothetical protein
VIRYDGASLIPWQGLKASPRDTPFLLARQVLSLLRFWEQWIFWITVDVLQVTTPPPVLPPESVVYSFPGARTSSNPSTRAI